GGLSPFWFFLGQERTVPAVSIELAARIVATIGTFALVRTPGQGWVVLALQALAGVVSTGAPTVLVYRQLEVRRPTWAGAVAELANGWSMFLFRLVTSASSSANAFILSLLAPAAVVANFGGAEKLVRALVAMTSPISQALYPRMAATVLTDRPRAARTARLTLLAVGIAALAAAGLLAFLAPWVTRLVLGPGYEEASTILAVLCALVPLNAANSVLGMQWLSPLGRESAVNLVLVASSVTNVVGAVLLVPRFGGLGMAISVVTAETLVVALLLTLALAEGLTGRVRGGEVPQ
ncbi:MAG TPA: oligosaccharide flippase family protein, partial [Deinococcales bacterium]|nr:oligosaccharide flippase family protein [Deinococcales bacterium]